MKPVLILIACGVSCLIQTFFGRKMASLYLAPKTPFRFRLIAGLLVAFIVPGLLAAASAAVFHMWLAGGMAFLTAQTGNGIWQRRLQKEQTLRESSAQKNDFAGAA